MKFDALQRKLGAKLKLGEPMSKHTSFKIGGPAEAYAGPENVEELKVCLEFCAGTATPLFFLAGGTNLLVLDGGVKGLTVKLEGEFKEIAFDGEKVHAGAGSNLALLAKKSAVESLSGLEFAVGIPGSLGGGLVMNAGAHGGELSQVVKKIGLVEKGALKEIPASEAGFVYRSSRFKNSGVVLLWADMELKKGDKAAIEARMEEVLKKRRETQPLNLPNAGCVFKNPAGAEKSAGWMIEQCGLKGRAHGGAKISEVHANFVVNEGGARAADVLALMDEARQAVKAKFGVQLENEVLVVGEK